MQNKELKNEFILITIPVEIIEESGVSCNGLIQITAKKGRIVIENVRIENETVVCNGNCGDCPVYEIDGENCPNLNS